jgi:anti-sigma factor RsiW
MKKREDAIIRYVSDEMTPEEKKQFEQQMAEDASLRNEVQELQATQKVLQSWPDTTFEAAALSGTPTRRTLPKVSQAEVYGECPGG